MTQDTQTKPAFGFPRVRKMLAAFSLCAVAAACSAPPASHPVDEPWDPYENTNRAIHSFNKGVDKIVLRPVAKTYSGLVGDRIETGVLNFSDNLSLPRSVVNNILQGNMLDATTDTYRFIVNSTAGLLGVYDTASELNMPAASDADFGETLAVWGVREGAYIELPLLGPASERATVGKVADFFLDPFNHTLYDESDSAWTASISSRTSKVLTERTRLSGFIDPILDDSMDSYAQLRSLYLQNRRLKLGGTGREAYTDPYEDPNIVGITE